MCMSHSYTSPVKNWHYWLHGRVVKGVHLLWRISFCKSNKDSSFTILVPVNVFVVFMSSFLWENLYCILYNLPFICCIIFTRVSIVFYLLLIWKIYIRNVTHFLDRKKLIFSTSLDRWWPKCFERHDLPGSAGSGIKNKIYIKFYPP